MLNKISAIAFMVLLIFSVSSFSQEKDDTTMNHNNMKMHDMGLMKDSSHKMMNHNMMKHNHMKDTQDSIVREGVIDLQAIDQNKDGKVFQDMMDYNVISDKPGKCPLCGMKLKEVPLEKAKQYLDKNGYTVK